MPCFHPVPARQDVAGGPIVLHPSCGTATMLVPCGGCLGCRRMRASEWARRCTHEAHEFEYNSFVTLTYDEAHVPAELVPDHLRLFIKALRRKARSCEDILTDGSGIRFFACGEYGGTTGRPHYHALLFNCAFSDKYKVAKDLYMSSALASLWKKGEHKIGEVTADSAAYVAKYNCKSGSKEYCDEDGVVLRKPFLRMSRRPGIGSRWLARFHEDLRHGFLVSDGFATRIPRAYLRRLERDNPQLADEIRLCAYARRSELGGDGSDPARLAAAELIAKSREGSRSL